MSASVRPTIRFIVKQPRPRTLSDPELATMKTALLRELGVAP